MNLLTEASDSKLATRKSNNPNDQTNASYSVEIKIKIYNSEVLKSTLYDNNDAYILLRGDITAVAVHVTQVAFKNCTSFTKCNTKIDETKINNAKYLNLVTPMYYLLGTLQIILTKQIVYGFILR